MEVACYGSVSFLHVVSPKIPAQGTDLSTIKTAFPASVTAVKIIFQKQARRPILHVTIDSGKLTISSTHHTSQNLEQSERWNPDALRNVELVQPSGHGKGHRSATEHCGTRGMDPLPLLRAGRW